MTDTMVVDVSQDWATACDVQQRFMHHAVSTAAGISCAARCRQLRALGGDCFDFLPLPHDQLAFAIADASGKSLPAALMIANVQSSMRTAASFVGNDPAAVLGAVNRQLHTASLADSPRYSMGFSMHPRRCCAMPMPATIRPRWFAETVPSLGLMPGAYHSEFSLIRHTRKAPFTCLQVIPLSLTRMG